MFIKCRTEIGNTSRAISDARNYELPSNVRNMTLNGSLCEKTNYGVLSPPRMKQNSNTLVRRKESLLSRHTRSNKILIINVLSLRFGSWLFAEVYWHKDKKMMKVNRLNHGKINFNSPTSNCVTFIFCNLALIIFSKPPQTLSRRYRVYIGLSPS